MSRRNPLPDADNMSNSGHDLSIKLPGSARVGGGVKACRKDPNRGRCSALATILSCRSNLGAHLGCEHPPRFLMT